MKTTSHKKPSTGTMSRESGAPDLTNYTEAQLLQATANILVEPGEEVTPEQRKQLDYINQEFQRREKLLLFPAELDKRQQA